MPTVKVRGAPTSKWRAAPKAKADKGPGDPRRAQAKLTVRRPNVPEVEIVLEKHEFVIGRQTVEVDLTLDDDLVSRKHARLTVDARGYFKLEDLGSKNGITFGGRTVRRLNLLTGDTFSIGKTEFVFHADMERLKQKAAPESPSNELSVIDVPIPTPSSIADEPEPPMLAGAEGAPEPDGAPDPGAAEPKDGPPG